MPNDYDGLSDPFEKDIIHRAVAGEADAFAELYDRYAERVCRFLVRRVLDRDLAEDLMAEVFLRAWNHLDGFDPGRAPFGAWLFRIARNLAVDQLRKRGPDISLEQLPSGPVDDETSVEATVSMGLQMQQVRRALDRLTPLQRDVLTLRFIDGLTTAEAAAALGRRPGAVRALQMRGLQALNAELESDDEDPDDRS